MKFIQITSDGVSGNTIELVTPEKTETIEFLNFSTFIINKLYNKKLQMQNCSKWFNSETECRELHSTDNINDDSFITLDINRKSTNKTFETTRYAYIINPQNQKSDSLKGSDISNNLKTTAEGYNFKYQLNCYLKFDNFSMNPKLTYFILFLFLIHIIYL